MEITLKRVTFSPKFTIGRLEIGTTTIWTLEDPVRKGPKVYGQTAIPAGRYDVIWNVSNRFKRVMPLLLNVPGFEGIRIHTGNTVDHTEGCILLGQGADRVKGVIFKSRDAVALFEKLTKKQPFILNIL